MSYTRRNFSPYEMFMEMAQAHTPLNAYVEGEEFSLWKERTLPEVIDTLGAFPEAVDLNAELIAEWEHDGLRKQRWHIDVSMHISAVCLVNIPGDLAEGECAPALLCSHGHGPFGPGKFSFGKEVVMGNDSSPDLVAEIKKSNQDFGHQMAKKGYVTFAIDWIGFGERDDRQKPNWRNNIGSRDMCNILYLHATMFGMTSLSINIAHGKAAIDFAQTLPMVDAERIGVMGISGGGTMALWMALCDERIKATEIICYSDLWECFGMRDANYCGMQVAPGLYKQVDLPDLQGLLAPRPLLVDIGVYDTCFKIDSAMACYKKVESIYAAADASDKLDLDLHNGAHAWGARKSEAFFGRFLEHFN